jgi:hypothetical protein
VTLIVKGTWKDAHACEIRIDDLKLTERNQLCCVIPFEVALFARVTADIQGGQRHCVLPIPGTTSRMAWEGCTSNDSVGIHIMGRSSFPYLFPHAPQLSFRHIMLTQTPPHKSGRLSRQPQVPSVQSVPFGHLRAGKPAASSSNTSRS